MRFFKLCKFYFALDPLYLKDLKCVLIIPPLVMRGPNTKNAIKIYGLSLISPLN